MVDAGQARVKRYSYRNKVEMLRVENISQAAADQRNKTAVFNRVFFVLSRI